MNLREIAKRTEKLIADNSPAILTALGVTGTLTVAFLTGQATFKAAEIIDNEQYRSDVSLEHHQLELKEKFQLVWKLYIPAASTGVLTIVCIIGANRIGNRRAAAVAAAFSISEKAIAEYKDKVIQQVGVQKEQKIRDEIAQDRINRNPVGSQEVVVMGTGDILCYDEHSGRYFNSDMETLKKGQNDINYKILSDSYASLSDFYDRVGLSTTTYSEEVGWTLERKLELKFSTSMSEDQRPCISIGFAIAPIRDYFKFS